jgi:SH3-like domain-containing protein
MIRTKRHLKRISIIVLGLCLFNALPAQAYDEEKQNTGTTTGLPLPRFASMKSSNINARSGPGDNYPIKAVYKRAGLPVQIVSEFKLWREIEDMEGERNWVHRAMLSGNRSAILNEDAYAYSGKSNSAPVAKLEKDAQIWIEECELSYCRMRLGGIKGWVSKASLWGVYPNEIFD